MINKLFIYGTLGPGRPNEHIMQAIGGSWQHASVCGKLHQQGWGAAMGYPGIILDTDAAPIEGFIFSSENLPSHWSQLDEFEGEAYERIICQAQLEDKNQVDAYIYALKEVT